MPFFEIRILSRRLQIANPWGKRVEFVQGNVTQPATLARALAGVESAIHSVQIPNHPVEDAARGWTFREVEVKGTSNLIRASREAGVRRLVYLSAAGAAPDHRLAWFRAKFEAERAILDSRLDAVILRPSLTYGPGDRSLEVCAALARRLRAVPVFGRGTTRKQPILVSDVARVAARALSLESPSSRVFDLAGPGTYSLKEIARMTCRLSGRRCLVLHLPVAALKLVAGLLSVLPDPPFSPESIDLALDENLVDPAPAQRFFKMKFTRLEEGLRSLFSSP